MHFQFALLVCALLKINSARSDGTGGFGFPEASEEDKSKINVLNKKPIDLPSKCRIGELLYPGDQSDDWVCDCKPGHIYYPLSDRCFAAYTRGPCTARQQLVLPLGRIVPECIPNVCPSENEVWFRGGCYRLNTAGPCHLPELNNVVSVDSTTLQLGCIGNANVVPILPLDLNDRFGETPLRPEPEFWLIDDCFIGGIRSYEGKCKNKT